MLTRSLTRGLGRPLMRGLVGVPDTPVIITLSGDIYAGSTPIVDGGESPYEYVINGTPSGVFTDSSVPSFVIAGDSVQVSDVNGILSNAVVATWEPDVLDYFQRAEALGGSFAINGTYTEPVVKGAWNTFVISLKSDGTWDELDEIFPGCGVTFAGATAKLKHSGNPVVTLENFVSGDYVPVGSLPGFKGDGLTKRINSNWIPSSTITVPSGHHSAFTTEEPAIGTNAEGAAYLGGFMSLFLPTSGNVYSDFANATTGRISFASGSIGFILANSTETDHRLLLDGILSATGDSPLGEVPAVEYMFFSYGGDAYGPSYNNARRAIRTMGQGLTEAQETTLNDATQALMASLGFTL